MFKLKPVCISYLWILTNLHVHHGFQMHRNFASILPNGGGHMRNMVVMPIYGENLLNLLHNQWADDLET